MRKYKVVVGLSGGVDSAVSAYLLKQQGHDLTGIYMQNWQADRDDPFCTAEQDLSDARAVCDHLQIPFQVVHFEKEYADRVFQHCLDEFQQGRTPNPDIWCNKEIKFKVFLKHALDLGASYLATGHYARIRGNNHYELLKGIDENKDQSYFLYTLGQNELSRALFPLGEYTKPQVREIAKNVGLHNYAKKDSTGICFIGERRFKTFLQEYLLTKPGPMVDIDGNLIGRHDGLMFYTIGQRKGLYIGGRQNTEAQPWFVIDKRLADNTLIVAQGHDHPALLHRQLICNQLHWVAAKAPKFPFICHAKTRYRQIEQACVIRSLYDDTAEIEFDLPQWAMTPGQSIVFYQGEICLGGGTIQTVIKRLKEDR